MKLKTQSLALSFCYLSIFSTSSQPLHTIAGLGRRYCRISWISFSVSFFLQSDSTVWVCVCVCVLYLASTFMYAWFRDFYEAHDRNRISQPPIEEFTRDSVFLFPFARARSAPQFHSHSESPFSARKMPAWFTAFHSILLLLLFLSKIIKLGVKYMQTTAVAATVVVAAIVCVNRLLCLWNCIVVERMCG